MKAVRGTIYPVASAPIDDGVMLFDRGKIIAVGPADTVAVPPGCEVIDAAGKVVTPGLVDAHTHAGLWPEWYGPGEDDANEVGKCCASRQWAGLLTICFSNAPPA